MPLFCLLSKIETIKKSHNTLDIVGLVSFCRRLALLFCDPPGSLTHPAHCPKYQYVIYHHPLEGVRFGY